jgi:hypothetical protein
MRCKKIINGDQCQAHALKSRHYCMFHQTPGVKKWKNRKK